MLTHMSLSHAVLCPAMALKCLKWHLRVERAHNDEKKLLKLLDFQDDLTWNLALAQDEWLNWIFPISFYRIFLLYHFATCELSPFVFRDIFLLFVTQMTMYQNEPIFSLLLFTQSISPTRNHVVFHGCSISFSKKLPIRFISNFSIFNWPSCQIVSSIVGFDV